MANDVATRLKAVRQMHGARVGHVPLVFRQEAVDRDERACRKRVTVPPLPHQAVRRPELEVPVRDLAVGILDFNVDPGMRIDPFHLGHLSLQLHRFFLVELRGEGMVRPHCEWSREHTQQDDNYRH